MAHKRNINIRASNYHIIEKPPPKGDGLTMVVRGMSSLILTHLGDSVPPYMKDCVHQVRLWNPDLPIYIVLWPCHKGVQFWNDLESQYTVNLVYTNTLKQTPHHAYFLSNFSGDMDFRKGYWRHVKERFFFVEELMIDKSLDHCISMEYDVLVYMSLSKLCVRLRESKQVLRMVRDNNERGHPAFLYVPTAKHIHEFNIFLLSILHGPLEDMQSLAAYADSNPEKVKYFPVISEQRNRSIPNRVSKTGHQTSTPGYLSDDSEHFQSLFDSLVVGQWIGGIDSRNVGGQKISQYENESALYSIKEMTFQWKKSPENFLWMPVLDGRPLCTIHMHSKALTSFLSDRSDCPCDDYDVSEVNRGLLSN